MLTRFIPNTLSKGVAYSFVRIILRKSDGALFTTGLVAIGYPHG